MKNHTNLTRLADIRGKFITGTGLMPALPPSATLGTGRGKKVVIYCFHIVYEKNLIRFSLFAFTRKGSNYSAKNSGTTISMQAKTL